MLDRIFKALALKLFLFTGTLLLPFSILWAQSPQEIESYIEQNLGESLNIILFGPASSAAVMTQTNGDKINVIIKDVMLKSGMSIGDVRMSLQQEDEQGVWRVKGLYPDKLKHHSLEVEIGSQKWQGLWSFDDKSYKRLEWHLENVSAINGEEYIKIGQIGVDIRNQTDDQQSRFQVRELEVFNGDDTITLDTVTFDIEDANPQADIYANLAKIMNLAFYEEHETLQEKLAALGGYLKTLDTEHYGLTGHFSLRDFLFKDSDTQLGIGEIAYRYDEKFEGGTPNTQDRTSLHNFQFVTPDGTLTIGKITEQGMMRDYEPANPYPLLGDILISLSETTLDDLGGVAKAMDHLATMSWGSLTGEIDFHDIAFTQNETDTFTLERFGLRAHMQDLSTAKSKLTYTYDVDGLNVNIPDAIVTLDQASVDMGTEGQDMGKLFKTLARLFADPGTIEAPSMADFWDYAVSFDKNFAEFRVKGLSVTPAILPSTNRLDSLVLKASVDDARSDQAAFNYQIKLAGVESELLQGAFAQSLIPKDMFFSVTVRDMPLLGSRAIMADIERQNSFNTSESLEGEFAKALPFLMALWEEKLPHLTIDSSHYESEALTINFAGRLDPLLDSPLKATARLDASVIGASALETTAKDIMRKGESGIDTQLAQWVLLAMLPIKGFVDTAQLNEPKWDFEIILDKQPKMMINFVPVPGFDKIVEYFAN